MVHHALRPDRVCAPPPVSTPQFAYATKLPAPVQGVSHTAVLLPGLLTMDWVLGESAVTITTTASANAWYALPHTVWYILAELRWLARNPIRTDVGAVASCAWDRVSIGFNDDASMVGADAVVGEPVAGAVREYYLGGKDMPLLKLQSMQDLRNTSIGQRDGVTVMQFTRALNPAAAGSHRRLLRANARRLSDGTSTKGNVPITARGQTPVV